MHRFLRLALKEIQNHDYDDVLMFRLSAVIVRGGAVISTGFNKLNSNGFVKHFSKGRPFTSMHAEMHAILQARAKTDLRGCDIYVARIRLLGDIGMARPCNICEHILRRYGIRKAYYTIDSRTYGVMDVSKSVDDLYNRA